MYQNITAELLTDLIPDTARGGRHVLVVFCGVHDGELPAMMVDDVPAMDRAKCSAFMDALSRLGMEVGATTAHLAVCRPGSPDLTPEDHLWIEAVNNSTTPLDFASLYLATPSQIVALV